MHGTCDEFILAMVENIIFTQNAIHLKSLYMGIRGLDVERAERNLALPPAT